MAYGIIGYDAPTQTNSTAQVGIGQSLISGSVWGDCQAFELLDEGTGFFTYKTWKDDDALPNIQSQNGTYTFASSTDSSINVAYTSTGVAVMFVKPMAPVAPNGSSKLWYEVNLLLGQSTSQSVFLGFATSTGLSSTLFPTSTTLLSTAGLIGFYMHADQPSNMDAVYQKPLNISSTSTTTITVLASTLTSAVATNPNPGNLNNPNPLFPGAPGGFSGSNWIKLGLRVDKFNAYWYVNGAQVAKKALDSTFDLADSYGAIAAFGTTTANTDNAQLSFFRTAAKISGQI